MTSDTDAVVQNSEAGTTTGVVSPKTTPPPPVEEPATTTTTTGEGDGDADGDGEAEGDGEERSSSEYESGRVSCDTCGLSVSFRDEATGGFSLREWQEHKETCGGTPSTGAAPPPPPPKSPALGHAPAKRRRAKRTEEERKAYLGSDPYVERFEAYRVLCKSCDKWIRLRPNSTYCSIPWDAHRKSCLAKKINSKNVYALDERNALFAKDPDVRKFDAERVLCNLCDAWLPLNPDNHLFAVQTWLQHRAACQLSRPPPPAPPAAAESKPKPDPSTRPPSPAPSPIAEPSFHDLNPANYTPAHESRRRNAEQRAATLRADSLIAEVEPNRVFCSLCQKWVQLRQDSSYCAYPWLQHRGKCLARHQRRAAKAAEVAEAKARKLGVVHAPPMHATRSLSADLESEDDARRESAEDMYRRHRERPRFHPASYKRSYDHRHAPYPHPHPHSHSHSHSHSHPHSHSHSHAHPHSHSHPHPHAYRPGTGSSTSSSARVIRAWNADVPPGPGTAAGGGAAAGTGSGGGAGGGGGGDSTATAAGEPRSPVGDRDVDMDAEGDEVDADGERDPEMVPLTPPLHRERERDRERERERDRDRDRERDRERERERERVSHRVMHHREREREHYSHPHPHSHSHSISHPHSHPHTHPHAHRRPSYTSPPPTLPSTLPPSHSHSHSHSHSQSHTHTLASPIPTHLDLDSPSGRRHFVHASILHLRGTTYEATDEMSVSALVAYLNAAVPVDKYEDFDTAEVVRVLAALGERGRVRFEGDLVWVC